MTILRLLILALGGLLILGGFAAIAVGGWVGLMGLWSVVGGLVIVAAVLLERRRYRSVAAEVGPEPPGPGGGTARPAARAALQPDHRTLRGPDHRVSMRVWVDATSGERRYRADR